MRCTVQVFTINLETVQRIHNLSQLVTIDNIFETAYRESLDWLTTKLKDCSTEKASTGTNNKIYHTKYPINCRTTPWCGWKIGQSTMDKRRRQQVFVQAAQTILGMAHCRQIPER